MILGCPAGECHYQDGNFETRKRIALLKKVLVSYGIEPERVRMELSLDPEGKRIPVLVKEMTEQLKKLGPLKVAA